MEHLHWKNLGHVLAGGNMGAGDVAEKKSKKPLRLDNPSSKKRIKANAPTTDE